MPQAKPLIQHSLRGIRRLLPENGHVAGRNSGFALTRVSVFPSRHQLRIKGWPVGISMTKLSPVHCRKSRQSARGRNAGCDQVRTENQEAEGAGAESGIYLPLSARASLLFQVARTGSYESTTSGYIASNTAQRYCQNDSTDEICTRSLGLWGSRSRAEAHHLHAGILLADDAALQPGMHGDQLRWFAGRLSDALPAASHDLASGSGFHPG